MEMEGCKEEEEEEEEEVEKEVYWGGEVEEDRARAARWNIGTIMGKR